ncbi:MAG: hypothetical protein PHF25_00320 [Candidatus Margulisbacteria bacterium]|nr:hypothetical protein [Candidatus Margulisiibacteriota bacterium]
MPVTNIPNNETLQFKPPGNYTRLQNLLNKITNMKSSSLDIQNLQRDVNELQSLVNIANPQQLVSLRDFIVNNPELFAEVDVDALLQEINKTIEQEKEGRFSDEVASLVSFTSDTVSLSLPVPNSVDIMSREAQANSEKNLAINEQLTNKRLDKKIIC